MLERAKEKVLSSAAMANNVFAVPVFLVVFRESLEAVIIVSILLAFLKKTLGGPGGDVKAYKKLRKQVCTQSSPFMPLITNTPSPRSGSAA